VKNDFKIIGEWFLPSKEKRVYGELDFKVNGQTTLELYGSFDSNDIFPEFNDENIILGLSSKSKEITLYGCHMTKSGGATLVKNRESGKSKVSFLISYIFIGLHVNSPDELIFDTISSEIFNLAEWVGINGFIDESPDFEKIKNREFKIEYKLPEPIKFKIDNEKEGKFDFIVNIPGLSVFDKSKQIKQSTKLEIKYIKQVQFIEMIESVFKFQDFLILALYRNTKITSIQLFGENHKNSYSDGTVNRKKVDLFFSSSLSDTDDKEKSFREMIFSYHFIKDTFPIIIQKWYKKYELLEPAFKLVFEQFYNRNRFTENTFLNLAQAAETFHARLHNHTKIPRDEYKIMKKDILSMVDNKYHIWLNNQFNFGNNLNLHTRLMEISEKYSNDIINKIIIDKEKFVKQVKHSRNYYTHYSKSSEKNALKGSELFYLSEKLKLLLVCSFLVEVGFKNDDLSKCLENVKWTLFNHLANWRNE